MQPLKLEAASTPYASKLSRLIVIILIFFSHTNNNTITNSYKIHGIHSHKLRSVLGDIKSLSAHFKLHFSGQVILAGVKS